MCVEPGRLYYLLVSLLLVISITACETPNSPDFGVRQSADVPVLLTKKFTFLGDANSLIDTTSNRFDSLFAVNAAGLVSLSLTNNFDFREFDEVIPVINIDSTNIVSTIGPVSFRKFTNTEPVDSASLSELTGGADLQEGDFLPGGNSPPFRVDLNTDRFEEGVVTEGSMRFNFTNNLGIDIRRLTGIRLISNGNIVGDAEQIDDIEHAESGSFVLGLPEGAILEQPLQLEIQIEWNDQNLQADSGALVFDSLKGENISFLRITGMLAPQTINNIDSADINLDEFEFTSAQDFVKIESGGLLINNIINNSDVAFNEVLVSSPQILISQSGEPTLSDSLSVLLQIPRESGGLIEEQVDLSGAFIQSPNNRIKYNVQAVTEGTESAAEGDRIRTLRATDNVVFDVTVRDVKISAARGLIKPVTFLLNDDQPANGLGVVDLLRLDEAQQTTIDGIDNLSDNTEDLVFLNPSLSLRFKTNIGLQNTITGALLGLDSRGNQVFLSGKEGSDLQVSSSDQLFGLAADGAPIRRDKLFKIDVTPAEQEELEGSVSFNTDNSTISEFVSNIPTDIRFVGKSLVNEGEEVGFVNSPVQIDLSLNLDVPLNIATSERPAVIEDTTDVTKAFGGLPGASSNTQIVEARINIIFANTLPLSSDLTLEFLSFSGGNLTSLFTLPAVAGDNLTIEAAPVNPSTRFTSSVTEGVLEINLTNKQALALKNTDLLKLRGEFKTTDPEGVKIRKNDALTIDVSANIVFESIID